MRKNSDIKKLHYVFVICLILFPLLNINQGIDVSDSTYSLGNYMFPDKVYGTWALSTYISNLIGSVIVRLPFGGNLVGANIYTGLILSLIALSVYLFLKNDLGSVEVFFAECIAICFCWIPTTILYNYLSYLFMVAGCLLLYKGLIQKNNKLLFVAGILLGINVFVRIPNLTQAAFIVVLWFDAKVNKETIKNTVRKTGICVAGYLTGLVACVLFIVLQYGIDDIVNMIKGLGDISSSDDTYTMSSMIVDTFMAYVHSFKWIAIIIVVFFGGLIIFSIKRNQLTKVKVCLFFVAIVVLYRFLWGRGMYSFRYYEDYSSIYEWGMVVLFISIAADIYVILRKKYEVRFKLLACISFITILIAPLGSNNYTFQNINNLFLVMPVTVYVIMDIIKEYRNTNYGVAVRMFLGTLVFFIAVQSMGFHLIFSFRDGTRGEKRDTKIVGVDSLQGIYTNKDRAENLQEVDEFVKSKKIETAILFGDCPGLAYVLGIPSAISTTWPDLDSFGVDTFKKEVDECMEPVIIRKDILSNKNSNVKYDYLMQHLKDNNYKCEFDNEEYAIFIKL